MSAVASQITGVSIVYSTICSGADQRKHQSSASLAFVRGIHRLPVNSPHKGPVARKMLSFDDVIMPMPKVTAFRAYPHLLVNSIKLRLERRHITVISGRVTRMLRKATADIGDWPLKWLNTIPCGPRCSVLWFNKFHNVVHYYINTLDLTYVWMIHIINIYKPRQMSASSQLTISNSKYIFLDENLELYFNPSVF